jgi:hypothetical protein
MDKETDIIVIDCGYVSEQGARDRADEIFALGVGKGNLNWGPSTKEPRIHILIPPKKVKRIFEALPISNKKTWYGATHSYLANQSLDHDADKSAQVS